MESGIYAPILHKREREEEKKEGKHTNPKQT
jgi:hypothetical protein